MLTWTCLSGILIVLLQIQGDVADCAHFGHGGAPTRYRACPYNPPGLEVTRGMAGHCSVGEETIGDCVTDEDCFLKKLGNICCYSRCLGITQCHRFP